MSGSNHDPRGNRDFVGARVIDPKLGLDAIRTIVVRRGVVAALLEGAPAATDSDSERCEDPEPSPDPAGHVRGVGDSGRTSCGPVEAVEWPRPCGLVVGDVRLSA